MKLTRDEQEMLEGKQGVGRQKAMELLVKYGDALGADAFIDTDNVFTLLGTFLYQDVITKNCLDMDDVVSEFCLDSRDRVMVDKVKAFTVNHIFTIDLDKAELVAAPQNLRFLIKQAQSYCRRIGINLISSCTPYQCGALPVFGEHCVWVESSAVAYANSVIGARTNINGLESSFASALTGKTPYWGFHLDECRLANVRVNVEIELNCVFDYDLMGYYVGGVVGADIPVYTGVSKTPNMSQLMALSSAGATSGGIEMYHIVGVTPEASTLERAIGNRKIKASLSYGRAQRCVAYEKLNRAKTDDVTIVSIGCPHYSLQQLTKLAGLLEGKKVSDGVLLLIYTDRQLKTVADRNGYTDIISCAGGHLMVDSCPLNIYLPTANVIATDSAKTAHYFSGMRGYDSVWYGTMEDCIKASMEGRWKGELD